MKDWASFIFTYWFVFLCEMYVYTFVHFFPCCITLFFSRLIDIGLWVIFTHSGHFSSLIPRMPTFTLAISYLITSNLLWFMDLTFQVPMQYCSLQHRTLLLPPVTSTTGYCVCFGSIPSFFLELFPHWSPVAYWAPTNLGSSSFSILSFCLFILFMGFSRQEYWSGLPFPSPVDHILSDLSTMTHPSWVAPVAWLSLIELDKAVVLVWLD